MTRILTPTQERFLAGFFGGGESLFYLTGGTALAAFYLRHRYSDDLDFFTRNVENLRAADYLVERGVAAAGLIIEGSPPREQIFRRFVLAGDTHPRHPLRKCELMHDSEPHFAEPRRFDGVLVDDLLSIAINKLAALGRLEPKDYVDLYLILQQGAYRLEDLIPRVQEKDRGLTPLVLADAFERVGQLADLRPFQEGYMLVQVEPAELIAFYRGWARRLAETLPPRRE